MKKQNLPGSESSSDHVMISPPVRLLAAGLVAVALLQSPEVVAAGDSPEVLYQWDMSTDPGWEMEGEWEYGIPTGQGGDSFGLPDPTSGATGDYVLGINNDGDFSIEPGGPFYLTSPPIDCSAISGTHLRFMRWLNIDWQPWVFSYIEVSNDGVSWTVFWENDLENEIIEDAWSQHELDISTVADGHDSVQVRWSYTVEWGAWGYSGWNLDDIEIIGVDDSTPECMADVNDDHVVQGADLTILLGEWGDCYGPDGCQADLDGNGVVDGADLTLMLGAWGPCF